MGGARTASLLRRKAAPDPRRRPTPDVLPPQRLHTREEFDGSGIGLALCQRVLARHGGHIWVELGSEHGSVFSFTLPRKQG